MQRWRKPPIFAFAYISPARSSKRRMSNIRSRIATDASLLGRSWVASVGLTAMADDDTPFRVPRIFRAVSSGMAASATPASARVANDRRTHAMLTRGADALFAGWIGLAAFALYCATLAQGFGWDDSGELATGVLKLAPVHSAGYAPYVWFGHVFTQIDPFGSDATRVNLWSALAGAAAVGLAARYVLAVAGSRLGACVAALVLATGPVFLYNATVASVYAFLGFAVALLLNAAHAWVRRPGAARLALFAFTIGLVGLAHAAGAAFAVGGVVLIVLQRGALRRVRDAVPLAAVLIPLAAVPLLSRMGNSTGFPAGHVQSSLGDVFTRTASDLADSLANRHGIVVHTWWLVLTLIVSLSPAALVLVPAGVAQLWRERVYLVCGLIPGLVSSGVAVFQRGGYAYWHVPLVLVGAIACGAGVEWLRRGASRPVIAALAVLLLVPPVAGGLYLAHSHREASGWSRATLGALPRGARVITPWLAYTPMRAQQVVYGVRADVRLELTPTGAPVDIATLHGDYAVSVAGASPKAAGAAPAGPSAGANFKGLSGLGAGPFDIGFGAI